LVVAPDGAAADAVALGASAVVLLGARGARALTRAGYRTRRFLPTPAIASPSVLVPLDRPRVARYALGTVSRPDALAKALRNHAIVAAGALGLPVPRSIVIGTRSAAPPFLVREAQALGLPEPLDWLVVFGRAIERSSFLLFEPGASRPSWVVKFSFAHRDPERFLGDERGLRVVAEVGPPLTDHTPSGVGVSLTGERPISVEAAASGTPLMSWLRAPGSRARKEQVVGRVARWLIDVHTASAVPGRAAEAFAALAFPEGILDEVGADVGALTEGLGGLPAVAEHGDLDCTHVLVDGDGFTVIDWEGMRRHGLPLVDLAFLLGQALPLLDGELDDPRYADGEAFARVFRGESPSAPLLFGWLREACDAAGIPHEAAGRLLSLGWLQLAEGPRRPLALRWFSDPLLGPGWEAWRRAPGG
ncbi:MAG TPA: hypothetical protein VHB30_03940, partial [Solirubrobacteraceae bacterium]|nr:hypothetical protein [Solirubrobacteraceae bacterium]